MAISVHVQYAAVDDRCPGEAEIERWVGAALAAPGNEAELTIRIVSEQEGAELNRRWRGKPGATNVLSFPAGDLGEAASGFLGDVVICAPVVAREAREQGKTEDAHWAHLVVHGTLHLLGYDHGNETDAGVMESLEVAILEGLGIANPYD